MGVTSHASATTVYAPASSPSAASHFSGGTCGTKMLTGKWSSMSGENAIAATMSRTYLIATNRRAIPGYATMRFQFAPHL